MGATGFTNKRADSSTSAVTLSTTGLPAISASTTPKSSLQSSSSASTSSPIAAIARRNCPGTGIGVRDRRSDSMNRSMISGSHGAGATTVMPTSTRPRS
ncbi:hypothetical protein A5703_19315 [Mycobacterium sp. E188]|nr:hypothetical protein A5703_19315 [Mycobacterium sp. E188]OBH46621.1 hypothetical protein A5691_14480 [Mycobacterium sp. E183]